MWILCVWPHSQGRSCSHFGRPRFGLRRKSIGKKYCQGLKTSPLEALNGHILNKHIFTHIFTQQSGWTYWWPIYLWYRIYVNQTVCHQPKQSPILMLSNVYARTRCCVTGPDIALLDVIFYFIGHLISNNKFWSLVYFQKVSIVKYLLWVSFFCFYSSSVVFLTNHCSSALRRALALALGVDFCKSVNTFGIL